MHGWRQMFMSRQQLAEGGWMGERAHHMTKPTQTIKQTRVRSGAKANKWMHMEMQLEGGVCLCLWVGVGPTLLFSFKVSRVLSCMIL